MSLSSCTFRVTATPVVFSVTRARDTPVRQCDRREDIQCRRRRLQQPMICSMNFCQQRVISAAVAGKVALDIGKLSTCRSMAGLPKICQECKPDFVCGRHDSGIERQRRPFFNSPYNRLSSVNTVKMVNQRLTYRRRNPYVHSIADLRPQELDAARKVI